MGNVKVGQLGLFGASLVAAIIYGRPIDSTTQVSFRTPGKYWLRAIVTDTCSTLSMM